MAQLSNMWTEHSLRQAQLAAAIPEQMHLQAWQAEQLQFFLQQGLPGRGDENWKYTSASALGAETFILTAPQLAQDQIDIKPYIIENTYRLVFINGRFNSTLSQMNDLPDRVILTTTQQAFALKQLTPENSLLSAFTFLNGALMTDGVFFQAPAGMELTKPIHILYLTSGNSPVAHMQHPRHIIQLQKNSSAIVIEDYCQLDKGRYFNNVVTQLNVSENSRLHYYKIQRESEMAFHIANTVVQQQRDSQVNTYHIATGGQLSREDLQFALQQSGASCELVGFYFPQQKQLIDYHTRIDHFQSHTQSQQYYKGILGGFGRGVFNGKIIAHPYAQQITAKQSNHNLLLAESAEINTKPELEVYADNVKCTHGATVGSIDKNALFYLRSRGISQEMAQHLLLCGFANEIFDRLPNQAIAQTIREHFFRRLST